MKTEVKVGLLVITTLALLGIISLRLTATRKTIGKLQTYTALLPDVSGLQSKSSIKSAGIDVGYIKEMKLQHNQAELTFEVGENVILHSDATISLRSIGFLGDKYLSLFPGTESNPILPPGSRIPQKEGGATLEQNSERMAALMDQVNELARILTEALKGPAGLPQTRLDRIMASLEIFSDELEEIQGLDRLVADLRGLAANLRQVSAKIDRGEGSIGKLVSSDETIDRINMTLSSAERVVSEASAFSLSLGVDSAWLSSTHASRADFDLITGFGFDRSILFGASIRPNGLMRFESLPDGSKTLVTDDTGATVNAQFSQRFGFAGVRLGLFEGFVGGGVDFWGGRWLRAYGEIYRFREDNDPQVNFGAEFRLIPTLYAWAGADFVSSDANRSFLLGAGFRFPLFGDLEP